MLTWRRRPVVCRSLAAHHVASLCRIAQFDPLREPRSGHGGCFANACLALIFPIECCVRSLWIARGKKSFPVAWTVPNSSPPPSPGCPQSLLGPTVGRAPGLAISGIPWGNSEALGLAGIYIIIGCPGTFIPLYQYTRYIRKTGYQPRNLDSGRPLSECEGDRLVFHRLKCYHLVTTSALVAHRYLRPLQSLLALQGAQISAPS